MTGFRDRQGFEDPRHERPDIFDLVGTRPQNDCREAQPLHVLLTGQIAVYGQRNLIVTRYALQWLPADQTGRPAAGTVVTS